MPHSGYPGGSRYRSRSAPRDRFKSQKRTRVLVGEEVQQPIWALPHVTDPLLEILEQGLTANGLAVFVEHMTFKTPALQVANKQTSLPSRKTVPRIERHP